MKTSFFSTRALESLRASGYRNTQYALAELVDNSFDAMAKNVKIVFYQKADAYGKKYIDEIVVSDDGHGMSRNVLQMCLQFGCTVEAKDVKNSLRKKMGKFGFGLPNASLSQCPNVHVFSRTQGGDFYSTYLNLQELKASQSIDIPEAVIVQLPKHFINTGAILNPKRGTIVAWRNCDRLSNSRAETIIEKAVPLLGRIYRYYLKEGRKITFEAYEYQAKNDTYTQTKKVDAVPNDPLFLMSDTYIARLLYQASKEDYKMTAQGTSVASHYKKFALGEMECHPTNHKLEEQSFDYIFNWRGHDYVFKITTSYSDVDIQKPGIREGGLTQIGQFYGEKKHIGFVRAGREIACDSFGFYKETEPRNRWWTIEIQFSPDADDLLGVHNNKQGIEFTKIRSADPTEEFNKETATLQQAREHLWLELSTRIEVIRKAVWKIVLNQHQEWDAKHVAALREEGEAELPGQTDLTTQASRKSDGLRDEKFAPEEKAELFQRLCEKYPKVGQEAIRRSIDNYLEKSRVRGAILYVDSEGSWLWSQSTVGRFLLITVNTNHAFYERIIAPFQSRKFEEGLCAIELLISSLAWEEYLGFATNDQAIDILELFRSSVGIHLNRYLKENNIYINEEDLTPSNDESETIN